MNRNKFMWKAILIFIFGLLIFQTAHAQKDTVLYYMKNNYQLAKKDSARFVLFILPPDTVDGKHVYPVKEFYTNGKTKLIGYSSTNAYNDLIMEGSCMSFFSNGARQNISNYKNGYLIGDIVMYYPNKKLYAIETMKNMKQYSVACYDTTGNALADNGNGRWVVYDDDFKHKTLEGMIKDSLRDGEWHEFVNDSARYVIIYKNGEFISTTNPNPARDRVIFAAVEKEPEYKGGIAMFYHDLDRVIVYPAVDRENNVQGRVLLTFVVEKDGTLTGIHAISAPSKTTEAAAIDAIKKLPPWMPGLQGGRQVRVQFT
jgi:TonB family protein